MAHPILMPKPGQMTDECVLVAWHKREGDEVHRGDVLFEIETDKSVMDVEAFDDGILLKRYVEEGQMVPVNAVCAYVGDAGEIVPDEAPGLVGAVAGPWTTAQSDQATGEEATPDRATSAPAVRAAAAPVAPASAAVGSVAPTDIGPGPRLAISPRASRLAASSGIDPRTVEGTGPGGRITERDVRAVIETASRPQPASVEMPSVAAAPIVAISAASRSSVPGAAAAPTAAASSSIGPDFLPTLDADAEPPRPLSRMRRVIAERLSWSASTIPHFSVTVAVDMTRLLELRQQLKAAGTQLSVTDFILAATAQTLAEFPEVNSRTDGTSVWLRRRVHLGLAVSVPNGLVVPVIRDADRRSLQEIHDRALVLAEAARNGTLNPDDMSGSTFSVSNLGMFGVDEFKAIINPGEAAILAVSSVIPTPVAIGDGLAVRQVMKLTLSADHRLVDGELAARFLNALRRRLQDAEAFRNGALNA